MKDRPETIFADGKIRDIIVSEQSVPETPLSCQAGRPLPSATAFSQLLWSEKVREEWSSLKKAGQTELTLTKCVGIPGTFP
jgi:hypothetical protein